MLSEVSLWLLENGYHVSIIARNAERMNRIMERNNSDNQVTPLIVDYRNHDELTMQVYETIKENGSIDIVVAWIHSIAKDALGIIVNEVSRNESEWELFHILGSSSDLDEIKRKISLPSGSLYRQIQLGFVNEGSYSRWLTNKEIFEGVIEGIKEKKNVHTIGQIEPWEKRP